MKKIKKYLSMLVIVFSILLLTGCGEKPSITTETFVNTMTSSGYNVVDKKDERLEYDYITTVEVAVSQDYTHQIEFYVLSTEDYAKGFYTNNKTLFQAAKNASSQDAEESKSNYSKYALNTGDSYKVISRIGNTVIYADVAIDYHDEVKSIIEGFGY